MVKMDRSMQDLLKLYPTSVHQKHYYFLMELIVIFSSIVMASDFFPAYILDEGECLCRD